MVIGNLINQVIPQHGTQKTAYERTLVESDLMSSTETITSGKDSLVAEWKVGADQRAEVGQGTAKNDPMEQGRPYIILKDDATTPVTIVGSIEIRHESAQGTTRIRVIKKDSSEFNQSTVSERIVLPKATSKGISPVKEDSYIRIYVNASTSGSGTISRSNSTIELPVTIYE